MNITPTRQIIELIRAERKAAQKPGFCQKHQAVPSGRFTIYIHDRKPKTRYVCKDCRKVLTQTHSATLVAA